MAFKAATAKLPGKAAPSCVKPVGVGVNVAEVEGAPAARWRSKYGVKMNHALLRTIVPPNDPPNLFSTNLETGPTVSQGAAGVDTTPGAQNPKTGFFSSLAWESANDPSKYSNAVP